MLINTTVTLCSFLCFIPLKCPNWLIWDVCDEILEYFKFHIFQLLRNEHEVKVSKITAVRLDKQLQASLEKSRPARAGFKPMVVWFHCTRLLLLPTELSRQLRTVQFTSSNHILLFLDITWRHGRHVGVPKQWNGGHVGVPIQSSGNWKLLLC